MKDLEPDDEGRTFTPEAMRRRRRRNVALALFLALLVVLFFITTLVRLGGNIADRAL